MCFTISTPKKDSLPFAVSSMVKLIEGWLSLSLDGNVQRIVHIAFEEIRHFALVWSRSSTLQINALAIRGPRGEPMATPSTCSCKVPSD